MLGLFLEKKVTHMVLFGSRITTYVVKAITWINGVYICNLNSEWIWIENILNLVHLSDNERKKGEVVSSNF